MSEAQLSALLAKFKEDAGLREKLQDAEDLDAAVVIAKDAGFEVSKEDWLNYQAKQALKLSDEELERAAGGFDKSPTGWTKDPRYSICEYGPWCS